MGDYTNPNVDETVLSAWQMAEEACFKYLCYITQSSNGKNAFIGDDPQSSKKMNVWTFMLSGSNEDETQNYQCPTPGKNFKVNGALVGLYKTRKEAQFIAGNIANGMPAYWIDDEDAEEGAVPNRGIENVQLFEMTSHAECFSVKEEDKDRYWVLAQQFRCVYSDSEN